MVFLGKGEGECGLVEVGLSRENKGPLLILSYKFRDLPPGIYFLLLYFLCRELPQPDGWHEAICFTPFLPPRDVYFCFDIFKGSLCCVWIGICNYTLWKYNGERKYNSSPRFKKKFHVLMCFYTLAWGARDQAPFDFFLLYDNHVLLTINKKNLCVMLCPVLNRTSSMLTTVPLQLFSKRFDVLHSIDCTKVW